MGSVDPPFLVSFHQEVATGLPPVVLLVQRISVPFKHCVFHGCSVTSTVAVATSCTGSFPETVLPEAQNRFREVPCV